MRQGQPAATYSYTPASPVVPASPIAPSPIAAAWSPLQPVNIPPTIRAPISAALLGAVIGSANSFGRNLHEVQRGRMTLPQAITRGVMHGAATSAATSTAILLTANMTDSDALHLAALAVTTAGLSYLIAVGLEKTLPRSGEAESTSP